jgi:dephospho-CoA kinase
MRPTPDVFRQIAWTRSRWINEIEAALGEVAILWFQAKLAEKNGKKTWARKWRAEFERELVRRLIHVAIHPAKRAFDRKVAFDEAVAEMPGTLERLREHVEREFGERVRVRGGLDDADVKAFWERARVIAGAALP